MPKVIQYGPSKVDTQVARQPQIGNIPVDTGSTGATLEGVASLAQGFVELNQRVAATKAEEAVVSFERAKNDLFFNRDEGYFNTQGRDAYDNAGSAREQLEKLRTQYADQLTDPLARREFDRVSAAHITRGEQDIMRHATKGMKAWEVATINAEAENSIENASLYWGDPKGLEVQRARGRQAILDASGLEGIDGVALNERLQTFDSSFATATVTAAITSSAAEGKESLTKWGDQLEGPDRVKLEKMLQTRERTEKTQLDAQQAVLTATRLVGQYENDRRGIQDEVNKIEDPELRDKTMRESMYLFTQRQYAMEEERAQSFEDAQNHLTNGGTPESFKAGNPDAWEAMTAKQRATIESGKTIQTDHVKLSELLLLPKNKLAEVDPADHFSSLAAADRKKLISAVRAAREDGSDNQAGRTRTAQTTATVEQLFGKKSKWNKDKYDRVNEFYAALTTEVQSRETAKGSPLTSSEYTAVLSDFSRQVVIEKNWWPDAEVDVPTLAEEVGISINDASTLEKYLRDNGVPVTVENMQQAYQQATAGQ